MQGVTEFMQQHEKEISKHAENDRDNAGNAVQSFIDYHLIQIGFLQHERLIHLLVMLFVILFSLIFFALFLMLNQILFLVLFALLLILSAFYISHYFKLENTVIRWYYVYNAQRKKFSDNS